MAIKDLDEKTFTSNLTAWLHVSKPISSFEYLLGREQQLEAIRRALLFSGRHVFIYGDRGVGKTSLARTAAITNSTGFEPIFVGCQPTTTFQQIISNIGFAVADRLKERKSATSGSHKIKIGASLLGSGVEVGYEFAPKTEKETPAKNGYDLNEAVAHLKEWSQSANARLLIVIDEFDRIINPYERKLFADFVKQVSDQEAPVQFIFCGVGSSLEELLAAHESSQRYFEGIHLERLIYQSRFEIIERSAEAVGLTVSDTIKYRIAAISDGFPHYIHLICSNLYLDAFNAEELVSEPTSQHYISAVRSSVVGMEAQLRPIYDRAVARDDKNFELVLWATGDHSDLQRSTRSIYDSYIRISEAVGYPASDIKDVTSYLQKLKTPPHGKIIKTFRRGWYEYSENVLRGYVRLRAEDDSCPLALEFDAPAHKAPYTVGTAKVKQRPLPITRSTFGKNQH